MLKEFKCTVAKRFISSPPQTFYERIGARFVVCPSICAARHGIEKFLSEALRKLYGQCFRQTGPLGMKPLSIVNELE
ncbi:hypothetical protein D9M71_567670 [compost metagenome]